MNEAKTEPTRKAPEIKPDYATMNMRLVEPRPRPWLLLGLLAAFIGLIWATAYALNADLPTWTDAPLLITAFAVGSVLFIGMMLAWVGW